MDRKLVFFAALFGLACAPRASAQQPEPPLAFHAAFDGSLEAVARGDGSPVGVEGPVAFQPGRVGQALVCGEGGAAVRYRSDGHLRPAAGTIEMWVCPLDWTGEEDEFHVFLEAKDPGWLVFYRYYQGGITALLGASGGEYRAAGTRRIRWQPGEWHHLATTWRASGLEVYLDGERAGTAPAPPVPESLGETFVVGDLPWHIARTRRTLIDEVKLYRVPLDAASIARAARGEAVSAAPELRVTLSGEPAVRELGVAVDAAGLVGHGERVRVWLVPEGGEAPVASAETTDSERDIARLTLPIAELPPGEYTLHSRVVDTAGATTAETSLPFVRPAPPDWRDHTLGIADRVLPPWTALQTSTPADGPVTVECWGRRYAFDTLLGQVDAVGAELLSAPVALEAVVDGETIALTGPPCRVEHASDTRVLLSGSAEGGGLRAELRHTMELDGFTWTDVTVSAAGQPVEADELRLVWRMPREQATLMHADYDRWTDNDAGALSAEGWSSPFTHFFWLGNEERGLSWYAERDQNWRHAPDRPALQARPEGQEVAVTVRLIAAPTTVAGPLSYGFGMMATPVRPRPKDARAWRMTPSHNATFDIVWPNGNMRWYGHPEPLDRQAFAERVERLHDRGVKVVPYVNLNFVSAGAPEWLFHGEQWADPARVVTPSDVAKMGYASMGTCPASRDWQDYIVKRIDQMIDRSGVDGIYIDCWSPDECRTGECAWVDADGEVRGTSPIRAYRELLRRVYTLFHERQPDPLIMAHMSAQVDIPILSFADTLLDGEHFRSHVQDDYLEHLPPAEFRAEFLGRNWGPVMFFLPELPKEHFAGGTPNLAAYLMLHDINPWPIWSEVALWNRMFTALDEAGIVDAEFRPYWRDSGASGPQQVLASTYVGGAAPVLVLMNTGEAVDASITLDAARLPGTAALDVLRDERFAIEGDALRVPLARHQGRVLVLR